MWKWDTHMPAHHFWYLIQQDTEVTVIGKIYKYCFDHGCTLKQWGGTF